MTDIISRAQELVKLRASMDKSNMSEVLTRATEENMFAQTLVEALAEDQWEYVVQAMLGEVWLWVIGPVTVVGDQSRAKWFSSFEEAKSFKDSWEAAAPTRLVRRRVSPTEVIDD